MVGHSTVSSGKLKKAKNTTIFFILRQFYYKDKSFFRYKTRNSIIYYF